MFDLNEQIIKWRSNLAQSETLGSSDIDNCYSSTWQHGQPRRGV